MRLHGPSLSEVVVRARSVRTDPLAFLEEVRCRYGDLVALPVPGPPVLLASHPGAVRQVLRSGAARWTKQTVQYTSLAAVTGPGLLANPGPGWIERRRAVAPAFHHARLAGLAEAVRAAAAPTVAQWRTEPAAGSLVEIEPLASRIALEVLGRGLLSQDLSPVAVDLLAATEAVARLVVARARTLPLPPRVPTPINRELAGAVAQLDRICHEVITGRRRAVDKALPRRGGDPADLLDLLLAAGLPDEAVRDELVTMVIAGHETVAAALTWTLLLLAEHPEAQARVRQEARGPGAGRSAGRREELPWTSAVVDEALRIHPPAWLLTRRAARPDCLVGQPVPEGTVVVISPWLLHRRAESWPDPERFDPGRFLDGGTAARADYIPFGLGPRLCIGRDFALLELRVLLAELLRDHRVSLPDGFVPPRREVFVTVRPRGLRLHVSPAA